MTGLLPRLLGSLYLCRHLCPPERRLQGPHGSFRTCSVGAGGKAALLLPPLPLCSDAALFSREVANCVYLGLLGHELV